jgi:hypothetical protein
MDESYEAYKDLLIKFCNKTIHNNRNEILKKHFDMSNTTSKTKMLDLPLELEYIIAENMFINEKYASVSLFINKNESLKACYTLNRGDYKNLFSIDKNSHYCEVGHGKGKFCLTLNLKGKYLPDWGFIGTRLTLTLYDSVADAKKDF